MADQTTAPHPFGTVTVIDSAAPADATPTPGFRIREIEMEIVTEDGETVRRPRLVDGKEVERYSIDVPLAVEAEGVEAIEAHVADVVQSRGLAVTAAPVVAPAPVADEAPITPAPDGAPVSDEE